jgi:hypothetical protein
MIVRSTTTIVVNYDADVLLPVESYHAAISRLIDGGADVMYPYSFGSAVQHRVHLDHRTGLTFVDYGYSLSVLDPVSAWDRAEFGFCHFFRRQAYIEGYLENENFVSYGPEDVERHHRFVTLGFSVQRVDGPIYHIEHPRTFNSSPANPFMAANVDLWRQLQELSAVDLRRYYEDQRYGGDGGVCSQNQWPTNRDDDLLW